MGQPDTANKLTQEQKEQLIGFLAEGCSNAEVNERLQQLCGETLHANTLTYYRQQYADEIDAAREEALKRAAQQGFSNRIRRIDRLQRLAEKLGKAAEGTPKDALSVSAEIRALLRDIRDEYGDLKTRQELTGKDGGPIKHDHSADGLVERILRDEGATDAALRLGHALRDGDADSADDGGEPD